ncbi:hypothetical protein NDU88_000726 [Pleurodeles waltl]|uniref:Uncharacterized protein n=1 Tax=Pleurodeles waltl TaxID=8319 RepID=A0AAV7MJP8_PLEWA|nr:hypothetical protein NDU88_000726 [Pleurodeles waltl]
MSAESGTTGRVTFMCGAENELLEAGEHRFIHSPLRPLHQHCVLAGVLCAMLRYLIRRQRLEWSLTCRQRLERSFSRRQRLAMSLRRRQRLAMSLTGRQRLELPLARRLERVPESLLPPNRSYEVTANTGV